MIFTLHLWFLQNYTFYESKNKHFSDVKMTFVFPFVSFFGSVPINTIFMKNYIKYQLSGHLQQAGTSSKEDVRLKVKADPGLVERGQPDVLLLLGGGGGHGVPGRVDFSSGGS